ncbi:hypothetical protein N0M98_09925 [Paenibacillus doosanensis]|uniref:Uncharacterized protein n=1 Tax=Paenibacillus konkukensis TaxID=2020716 RepID=A0ABY4S2G1_9BACL|nr:MULTISPECIES: hypothetical protein [Paenibacillus]MCS7460457.1 hypothetical protein [Paenibacillus doosanensis]UQZ87487.1 hypothetical protein SK3146_06789 [Paenibacillus konkukensis]
MEPIDDELKKGLASGPLTRNGFSDTLKKRIGERLDEQDNTPRKWLPWLGGISAVLVAAAVFLSVDWHSMLEQGPAGVLRDKNGALEAWIPPFSGTGEENVSIHSAVLIGLRTDHPQEGGAEYSTYRTLLLAGDQGELQKVAEGDGILMPYKTDFMKIVPQSLVSSGEESRVLSASLASELSKARKLDPKPAGPLALSEKLLFAGNRYLSVAQTVRQTVQGKETRHEYVWVKELQDIAQNKARTPLAPASEPHVSMKTLYGSSIQSRLQLLNASKQSSGGSAASAPIDDTGDSWTIVRKQGQWVPQLASYNNRTDGNMYRYLLQDVPITLPDSVVSYDRLSTDWSEIRRIRPDAKDAFSSPNNELLGVVTDSDITVYPSEGQIARKPLMTLSLAPNESVVMLQWAVNEPFIEMWKDKGKKLLGY